MILEREVKFQLDSWEEGERRLAAAGAALHDPRHFERNILFDFPGCRLEKRGEALRLRRAGDRSWLTFKGAIHGSGRIKGRREYETTLDDARATKEILHSLGLKECFVYEKYRAVYSMGELTASLDETPVGCFMEVEGAAEQIEMAADKLGFPMEGACSLTYPRLYQLYRDETPQAPHFMVFTGKGKPQ